MVNRWWWREIVVLIVVAGLLAGCDRSKAPDVASAAPAAGPPSLGASGTQPAAAGDAALTWVRCMRGEGVRIDDPAPDGSLKVPAANEQDQTFKQAYEKCRDRLPAGAPAPGRPDPAVQAKALKYARCMRQNGVAGFPDPGVEIADSKQIAEDPQFAKAYAACASIIGVSPELPASNEPGHG